ncbi:MAG: TetR/AcrR family transcriptional regulator [Pseudomonadota bacterium]
MSDKREQLEAIATQAIQKDGVRSVSFRTLADAVGVKSASVHYHFPTKSDLTHAVVSTYTEAFVARLEALERKHRTLSGKLNAFIRIFDEVLADDDLCLCGMMAAELTSLDAATQHALKKFFSETEAWLERTIDAHRNELTAPLPGKHLAKVLMSGLEGAVLLDRVDGGDDRLRAMRALVRAVLA